ncbi:putative domain HDIG-containing protein [Xenococcus sp. PCC 7305]|uniref:HD family phosphohydrolase n=1 Tax=Xenococcus sp. PCC 7305 TaxID=102125 RepID=UPI0002ACB2EE|nr:HDIG domain-containing metalloprotein [Xenococcus sp. PCC 7305]ELS01068.1 putative domain HDIG-containing protein [Xenococcus sp. PCC 7305]
MIKSWHLLTKKIDLWQRKCRQRLNFLWFTKNNRQIRKISAIVKDFSGSNLQSSKRQSIKLHYSLAMLIFALVALTSVVGYRFYNQPQLTVGKISPIKIEAPWDDEFEDTKTTLARRKEVQRGIVPILRQDKEITEQIRLQLAKYLERIEQLRVQNQPFPFFNSKIISLPSQQYLRSCSSAEFQAILKSLEPRQNIAFSQFPNFLTLNVQQQQALEQLRRYQKAVSRPQFKKLIAQVDEVRSRYVQGLKKFRAKPIPSFDDRDLAAFLTLSNQEWVVTKTSIEGATERIIAQGIAPGTPRYLLSSAVALQLGTQIPKSVSPLVNSLLLNVLQPNLQENREATRELAEKAAQEIAPVMVAIKKGQIIVDAGDKISQADFVLLDGFGLSRRGINWLGLRLSAILVLSVIGVFVLVQRQIYPAIRRRDYLLVCLLSVSAPLLSIFNVAHTNLAAIGLFVSSFYNPLLAICHVSLLTILVTWSQSGWGWEYLIAGSAGGLLAAAIAGTVRSREAMARLGVVVGLTQGVVYLLTTLILSASAATIWLAVLPGAIIHGLWGVAWCIVAIGISPYLERFFDLITPIRLAELSNPNLPLLKRLATEAPGTFQHTMFVCCLAESAARKLNCNVELVRAGTLYHDIGKMHDPLGFIENQMGGPNKHDEINNPWVSAEIIKKHVSEGLVMAKKYGLPQAIRDFIPEHQGTLLIAYFYHHAKQNNQIGDEPILEADFRYDGPIPQSREAGIMMLADGCEAALRSLKDATPEQALSTIKKIFKARWKDDQLVDSGLSYDELRIIADVFVQVWQQFNHKRIAYPKGALNN